MIQSTKGIEAPVMDGKVRLAITATGCQCCLDELMPKVEAFVASLREKPERNRSKKPRPCGCPDAEGS